MKLLLLFLIWDYDFVPGQIEFEVWHKTNMVAPFTLLSIESFAIMPIQPSQQTEFYIVRARLPWATNVVSDWNK